MTTILITGGAGQVGLELTRLDWGGALLLTPNRTELDLASADSITAYLDAHAIDVVINSAAHTAVDKAQTEVGAAFAANAVGPALLADRTRASGALLIQVSTDYVFAGDKPEPYVESDAVGPLGVYGASKLAGEYAARLGNPRSIVLRTAWVLSAHRTNFLKTMLRLAATRPELTVVADQHGCPTSAVDIAAAIRTIVQAHLADALAPTGIYHFVNAGEANWCELANTIFELAALPTKALPIASADYPTAAPRPANSRLSTAAITRDFGVVPRPWRAAVADIVQELTEQGVDA